jgi:hypothetical protein
VLTHGLGAEVFVPAGSGVFVCRTDVGSEVSLGGFGVHFRARTWLHRDLLSAAQEQRIIVPEFTHNLGQSWLMPAPSRSIEREGNRLHVAVWAPGLPDNALTYPYQKSASVRPSFAFFAPKKEV